MQTCFMFVDSSEAKAVQEFLTHRFAVITANYLGHDILCAPKKDYKHAIIEGIKFMNNNNIRTAEWISATGQYMPLDCISFLFAKIPDFWKRNSSLQKIFKMFCFIQARKYAKFLGESILVHYTPLGNVEFRLVRNSDTIQNHDYYVTRIIKYYRNHRHIFNHMLVYDAYGNQQAFLK